MIQKKKLDLGLMDSIQVLNNMSINFDDFFLIKKNLIAIKHEKKKSFNLPENNKLQNIYL